MGEWFDEGREQVLSRFQINGSLVRCETDDQDNLAVRGGADGGRRIPWQRMMAGTIPGANSRSNLSNVSLSSTRRSAA